MRERRMRLVRLSGLLKTLKDMHEGRAARLSREEAALAVRENDLLASISAFETGSHDLRLATSRLLPSVIRDRFEARSRFEAQAGLRLDAERRARAAERALCRVAAGLRDQAQRRDLEELRLAARSTSASGKLDEGKI